MRKGTYTSLLCLLIITILAACRGQGKSFVPPIPGYYPKLKKTIVLDNDLIEISGMYLLADGKIAAINDEEGKIFLIDSSDGDFKVRKFGKKRDYEDIVQLDTFYFVLESNGNIHRVPVSTKHVEEEYEFFRKKKIEFESLYIDKDNHKLILLSKEQRETNKGILAYSFDPVTLTYSDTPVYIIRWKEIRTLLKNSNAEFKPSAAAIHPVLNKLFIVASVGKALLITDLDGHAEAAYHLNPDQFQQPEGITFAPNGDMFISNEGANGKATILRFPYRPDKK